MAIRRKIIGILLFIGLVFPVTSNAQIFEINTPPELSLSTEDGFTSDPVDPDSGSINDEFTFRVRYRDSADAPEYIRVCFSLSGVGLKGCHDLDVVTPDLDPSNVYEVEAQGTVQLQDPGEYTYFFRAEDVPGSGHRIGPLPTVFGDWDLSVNDAGYSNVAFIPGFEGSRLYRQNDLGIEDELWVPTDNSDARQLLLDDAGNSIDPDIYTRDIIDRTKVFFPIYEDFINFMNDDMVGQDIINEWRPLPYDWRMSVSDAAAQPIMKQHIEDLAASSASGKVTIIAHSNGGLIAKLLLNDSDIAAKVDRLIMIATPQLGTPDALPALLHGDGQAKGLGIILNKQTARTLAENMPGAYGLLPSQKYFDTVADAPITFTDEVQNNYDFRRLYGESIDTFDELMQFLQGDKGKRTEPEDSDLDSPNVLNTTLLNGAEDIHNTLDNWTAPNGVEVIQVAGWGLDTVYGVEYDDCDFCPFGRDLSNLDRDVQKTYTGDGTVVVPSSLYGSSQNYYVNLLKYNRSQSALNLVPTGHANILQVTFLTDLIMQVIQNNVVADNLPEYISISEPTGDTNSKYRLRMKSPVSIDIYDSSDRHTGLTQNPDSDIQTYEEQIPNSSYLEIGEKKYISLDQADTYTIQLDGKGSGTFTFEIDTMQGDQVVNTTSFSDIPVTSRLIGTLTLSPESDQKLHLDLDGDGQNDTTLAASKSLKAEDSIKILRQAIKSTDIPQLQKGIMLVQVKRIETFIKYGYDYYADKLLGALDQYIVYLANKTYWGIDEATALPLREIIASMRETL